MIYDTIIIGKGPAGISAAIYLKRAGVNAMVIGKQSQALDKAELIENYYGFAMPVNGKKLFNAGVRQAKRLDIPVINREVVGAEFGEFFGIKTSGKRYLAKSLVFAIGKKRRTAPIPGIDKYEGSGVSYCAVCDGFFYKGKDVAVIGSGSYAVSEAKYLSSVARSVTVFTDGAELAAAPAYKVVSDKVTGVTGSQRVEALVAGNTAYPVHGIFMAAGSAGAAEFALKLGLEIRNGNIAVDADYATNIPGVYAAGDCIGGFAQVAKAVSDGAHAATSLIKYLRSVK